MRDYVSWPSDDLLELAELLNAAHYGNGLSLGLHDMWSEVLDELELREDAPPTVDEMMIGEGTYEV
jgi:hypothetical protein